MLTHKASKTTQGNSTKTCTLNIHLKCQSIHLKGQSAMFFVIKMIVFLCSSTQQVDCGQWTLHGKNTFHSTPFSVRVCQHTMPSWHSPLPHTVNSWTVFYQRQVTFRFVQTLIQALTLINWLWPHVLSALANSQRADMEGGKFVMEQRKKDKKGDSRDEKGHRK